MPTNANTPDQRSDRYARYIQVGPTPATHLSRWVHPNGTTKSHPPPSIVKALTPSQLADTPSSALPHNHAHLGRALMSEATTTRKMDYFRLPRPLWRKLKKYLPKPRKRVSAKGGRPRASERAVADAIWYVL